ncbi:MAG: NagC5, partial [Cyanobacteria bacterium RYN_339]|nr:NagC5 [Cyanobacteria bacterium RYN_339]
MSELALGVDIGGTKILTGLVAPDGRVLRQWRTPTDASRGGPAVMEAVEQALQGILTELPPDERPLGVGVCAAGQVDFATGRIAYASPNIPGWAGTPVKARLETALGLPVTVDNDGNAAAYGEWWAGAGKGLGDIVMLTVGTGVGGGIVLGGEVLRGGRFRGGEVGHMILVADGEPCNCGQRGCLEVYASGTAIARLARQHMPGWEGAAPDVFELAAQGEAEADFVLANAARNLALGLVSLGSVLDPDRFIVGGGVASAP